MSVYELPIQHVVGDLLESDEEIIAHGCNTVGVMGAGIALAVKRKWGEAIYDPYEFACADGEFIAGAAQRVDVGDKVIYNLATQRDPGRSARYWWVLMSFANMFERMHMMGDPARVAVPRIGCGIGGLEWSGVEHAIRAAQVNADDSPIVVVYTHPSDANKTWR